MKVATSYFYQVRNFTPDLVPISTAMSSPFWFHDKAPSPDTRGIINGIKAYDLVPGPECHNLCFGREKCQYGPVGCPFLDAYSRQLCRIDFASWMNDLEDVTNRAFEAQARWAKSNNSSIQKFPTIPTAVFLVHEAPDNPCSERIVIQRWFEAHGVECKELQFKKH